MSETGSISAIFSKNRAEENPDDLWGEFVLPLNYESFNLLSFEKGNRIVGVRGSGKTTYLKYHCYPTQLSHKRSGLDTGDIDKIGIYWKPDTVFAQMINERYLGEKWQGVFNTYAALSFLKELGTFFEYFVESSFPDIAMKNRLRKATLSGSLAKYLSGGEREDKNIKYIQLASVCRNLLKVDLAIWLNMPMDSPPVVLPGKIAIENFIEDLKEEGFFRNTTFHIFIDEFENLTADQQTVVNTWMKHGKTPLLFSVAYKKLADVSDTTLGQERLQSRDDYRMIDIVEDVYAGDDKSFKVLASEIIVLKLNTYLEKKIDSVDGNTVSSAAQIQRRLDDTYQQNVLEISKKVFPSKSYNEIAKEILEDNILYGRLLGNIEKALKEKNSNLEAKKFISPEYPAPSVVNGSLLYRKGIKPEELLEKFQNLLKSGEYDRSYKEQVDNTLVGSILLIYVSYSKRVCPIYAGFDAFCNMARKNLRHLLELCHQSFVQLESSSRDGVSRKEIPVVPTELQAKAAKKASKAELERIAEFGRYGKNLQAIAYRLGTIFQLRQEIKSQSEPEVIHFSIKVHDIQKADEEISLLFREAELWNVLLSYASTKNKTILDISTRDWMLTPMLSPYFKITHRKIRKIEFSIDEIGTIFTKNEKEFENLYRRLAKKWINDDGYSTVHSLFEEI